MNLKINTKTLIKQISNKLISLYSNIESSKRIAIIFIESFLKIDKINLILQENLIVKQENLNKLYYYLERHIINNMPLAYILKEIYFLDLKLNIKKPILIPRPETEYWCSKILEYLHNEKYFNLNILDLCTGSGCIGLTFAKFFPNSTVYLCDISKKACNLAYSNAKKNNIKNIKIIKSNLYDNLKDNVKFDIILSNPPYISYKKWQNLEPSVKEWEDFYALAAKDDGLELIKKIINQAPNWLRKINTEKNNFAQKLPLIAIEIDFDQADQITLLLEKNGFYNIEFIKDLNKIKRTVIANL